jgi:4-amino-4-deoxy-L-arabinose transferase-like glycosyltransferase
VDKRDGEPRAFSVRAPGPKSTGEFARVSLASRNTDQSVVHDATATGREKRTIGSRLATPVRTAAGLAQRLDPRWLVFPLILAVVVTTFLTSTRDEDLWWADGASFALNGEFLRDYLASGLTRNPMAFAMEWFRRYPALTISLYPPIFPLAEAVVFSVAGFSHAAALATVTLFAAVAAFGIYRMARTAVGVVPAGASAILLFATPEVLRWSRQVVLDVPAMAFLLLAAAALLRYQAVRSTKALLTAVALTLAAIYTKQTAIFIVPAFVVALLADERLAAWRRKSTWIAVAVGVIGIVPLAIFTAFFATENINIAFGATTGQKGYDRLSVQALLAYGQVLPEIVGFIPLAGSALYLALILLRGWSGPAERRITVLMVAWFIADYLAISVTADFEPRYAMLLTVPAVVLSILLITRMMSGSWADGVALAIAVSLFANLVSYQPVIRVEGYGDIAQYVLEQSKQDDVVLFHGMGSKNFVLSIRTRSPVPRIFIERAEKHLVDYSIMRDWGIADRMFSVSEVEAMLNRHKIAIIVFQPNFWTDQPSIAALQRAIISPFFRLTARFQITSEEPSRRAELLVYRRNRVFPPAD